jgi:hypothetical protein
VGEVGEVGRKDSRISWLPSGFQLDEIMQCGVRIPFQLARSCLFSNNAGRCQAIVIQDGVLGSNNPSTREIV